MYIVFINNTQFYTCETLPSAILTQKQFGGKIFEEANYTTVYPPQNQTVGVGGYADWM